MLVRRSVGVVLATLLAFLGSLVVSPPPAAAVAPGTASFDTVNYWNSVLLQAFRRQGGAPTPLSRAAAMMHAGIFDVLNSAQWSRQNGEGDGFWGYSVTVNNWDPSMDDDLAAGYAARDLLIEALPAQQAFVAQKFTERYGTRSQASALAAATQVVNAIKQLRANDGANATPTYTFDNVPGAWRLTGHLCTSPATPHWGTVRPFVSGTAQYRPSGPGGHTTYADLLASNLYATNLAEARSLGRANSTTRTAEQTQVAWFWANDLDGTYKPPGQLLEHTAIIARALYRNDPVYKNDPVAAAKFFAQSSLAMADAAIAAWDRKYLTSIDLWRPQTAIQLDATNPDPSWEPLSADRSGVHFNPCFPAWISGHATFAGAWAGIWRFWLGDSVTFTATTDDPHAVGVTRQFTSFTAAARENARSRIYLGVHYQFDADDGVSTGLSIGQWVAGHTLVFAICPQLSCPFQ